MSVCRCTECVNDKLGSEKLGAFLTVVGCTIVFGPVVSFICWSRTPIIFELFLMFAVTEPPIAHVHGFGPSGENVVSDDVRGVLLSVWMGVGGCLCPIFSRRVRQRMASRALMYKAPRQIL